MADPPWTLQDRLAHLEERIAVLERTIRLGRLINSTLDLSQVLELITQAAIELIGTDASAIALLDPETGQLYFETASGPQREMLHRFPVPLDDSIAGWVIAHNEPVIVSDAQRDPRHCPLVDTATGLQTRSLMEVPLTVREEVIGIITAANYRPGLSFTTEDLHTLRALATQAATAIHNARLFEGQRRAYAALQEANAQLQDLDRLKSDFIAVITHELRTPIANLDLAQQVFERLGTATWSAEQRTQMDELKAGIRSTQRMIDNLIAFATFLSNRGELRLEWLDLSEVVRDALIAVEPAARHKQIHLVSEIASSLPPLHGDRTRLGQAVYQLLDNAVKFTPAGGQVWVRCRVQGDYLRVEVEDTGTGIPEKRLPTLWQGLTQHGDPMLRGQEGLGIGLALVKQIVDAHSGQVDSRSIEDAGSTFAFVLPLTPAHQYAPKHQCATQRNAI
jgi:signal transduction histidine kinase